MKLMVIHLSDIHFKGKLSASPVLNKCEKIRSAIRGISDPIECIILIVSGDTAFSGSKAEYEIAINFYKKLVSGLKDDFKKIPLSFLLIPGNHDCNFSLENDSRRIILESSAGASFKDETPIGNCLIVQTGYQEFVENLEKQIQCENFFALTSWYSHKVINISNVSIGVHLLNSAWCSSLKERQGQLTFPTNLLKEKIAESSSQELVISTLHHPFAWFEANNARELRHLLEDSSDLILTGHEHEAEFFTKLTASDIRNDYVEGGVLQDSDDDNNSSFNVVLLDTEESTQVPYNFNWQRNEGHYLPPEAPSKRMFQRNRKRQRKAFPLTEEFEDWLHDPGVKFTHPTIKQLQLDHIFVYPDLREIRISDDRSSESTIPGKKLVEVLEQHKNVLIVGAETSGKTSLAKRLVLDLRKTGIIPLYLKKLDRLSLDNPRKALNPSIIEQYGGNQVEPYWQLEFSKRALIIDDYNELPGSLEDRARFLTLFTDQFELLVIFGGDEIRIEELKQTSSDLITLYKLKHLEILEFGFVLRSQLVQKWYGASIDGGQNISVTHETLAKAEQNVTAFIGGQFMPSYPLFILIVLQQLEIDNPHSIFNGSVGYLYEVLINENLLKVVSRDTDIDTNRNYLSEFAYALFDSSTNYLTTTDAKIWHQEYCERYKYHFDFNTQKTSLISAGFLIDQQGNLSFRYPYLYYYFVARHLSNHISEEPIKEQIKNLSSYLHQVESANIVLFLCHLSSDPFVFRSVVNTADSLFNDFEECELDEEVKRFQIDHSHFKNRSLGHGNPEDNRQKVLKAADKKTDKLKPALENNVIHDQECDLKKLNDQMQMNAALKTIQIIGQILKNHVGSLKGEIKHELVSKSLSLGLRAMKCLLGIYEENIEPIIDSLIEANKQRQGDIITKESIITSANKSLWGILELGVLSIVKYTSDSLGSEKLVVTWKDVIDENRTVAMSIIDLSVRLDHFEGFPKNETLELVKRLDKKNPFALAVVRDLIWLRFYLHHEDYRIKQSISQKLNISSQGQRKIISNQNKKDGGGYGKQNRIPKR